MFESGNPRRGSNKAITWTVEKLKGGGQRRGWKAGETVWILCHFVSAYIPCYHEITGGVIECPLCRKRPRTMWKGYTPWYAESERRMVCVLPEEMYDADARLHTHDAVKFVRGQDRGDAVSIFPLLSVDRYQTTDLSRKEPADIRQWLLTLWKQPTLTDYFRVGTFGVCGVSSTVTTPVVDDVPADVPADLLRIREEQRRMVSSRPRAKRPPETVGEVLPMMTPSVNGDHPGTGDGG